MDKNIEALVAISKYYGNNPAFIIAGGGNTSFKDEKNIWVKASGTSMATIDEGGFVCLDREKMQVISTREYSTNSTEREQQVKEDLANAIVSPANKRPSVETSMHEIIRYPFVVHTHPTLVNGLLCGKSSKTLVKELFGTTAIYVEYTDPGYILFKKVEEALETYRNEKGKEAQIIFLENHGIFVAADTVEDIKALYQDIDNKLMAKAKQLPNVDTQNGSGVIDSLAKSIKANYPSISCKSDTSELAQYFTKSESSFANVKVPFTPDIIVYCKSKYLYTDNYESIVEQMEQFENTNGYRAKVIAVADEGILTLEENDNAAQTVMDVYKDMLKIAHYAQAFGGPRPMTPAQIDFIDNWEVENYRRQVAKENSAN